MILTPPRLADTWATSGTYYNCCGPTETTIVNTMHLHTPGQPLTIGKPTPNNNVYILDDDLRPVELGQAGVMWAGGWGVSRGYINLPDKTAERYIPDPFTNDGYVHPHAIDPSHIPPCQNQTVAGVRPATPQYTSYSQN